MLDETSLRREDFRGGLLVAMADGQEWTVPQPQALWMADDSEDGYDLSFDLGPEYDALYRPLGQATSGHSLVSCYMKMFSHLLRLNYTLDSAAIGSLLRVNFGPMLRGDAEARDANEERFLRLKAIALGNEPLPQTFLSGSASPG